MYPVSHMHGDRVSSCISDAATLSRTNVNARLSNSNSLSRKLQACSDLFSKRTVLGGAGEVKKTSALNH